MYSHELLALVCLNEYAMSKSYKIFCRVDLLPGPTSLLVSFYLFFILPRTSLHFRSTRFDVTSSSLALINYSVWLCLFSGKISFLVYNWQKNTVSSSISSFDMLLIFMVVDLVASLILSVGSQHAFTVSLIGFGLPSIMRDTLNSLGQRFRLHLRFCLILHLLA